MKRHSTAAKWLAAIFAIIALAAIGVSVYLGTKLLDANQKLATTNGNNYSMSAEVESLKRDNSNLNLAKQASQSTSKSISESVASSKEASARSSSSLAKVDMTQAQRVTLLTVKQPDGHEYSKIADEYKKQNKIPVFFKVHNDSGSDIHDVLVLCVSSKDSVRLDNLADLYGQDSGMDEDQYFAYSEEVDEGTTTGYVNGRGNAMNEHDSVAYFFRDKNHVYWFRSNDGQLEEVGSKDKFKKIISELGIHESNLDEHGFMD